MTEQEFNLQYLGKGVHCDTEEKAKAFLKLAERFGYTWFGGNKPSSYTNYDTYGERTAYQIRSDITFSRVETFELWGVGVVKFELDEDAKNNKKEYKLVHYEYLPEYSYQAFTFDNEIMQLEDGGTEVKIEVDLKKNTVHIETLDGSIDVEELNKLIDIAKNWKY